MTDSFFVIHSPKTPLKVGTFLMFAGPQTNYQMLEGVITSAAVEKDLPYKGGTYYTACLENGTVIDMGMFRAVR